MKRDSMGKIYIKAMALLVAAVLMSLLMPAVPTFAEGVPGWGFINSGNQKLTWELDKTIKHSGNASLRISYEAESGNNIYFQLGQNIPVKKNTSYTYGLWIKGDKIGNVQTMISWGTRYHHKTFGDTFDWKYCEFSWFSGEATSADFQVVIDSTTKNVWFDDITFFEDGHTTNLIINPGFEDGVTASVNEVEAGPVKQMIKESVIPLSDSSAAFTEARYIPIVHTPDITIDGELDDWKEVNHIDNKNDTISAKFYSGYDDKNFLLAVEVEDEIHNAMASGAGIWQFDSIQFVIGRTNEAYGKEVSASFEKDGQIYFTSEQWHESDYMQIKSMGKRKSGKTIYEISIPWTLFGVEMPEGNMLFNLLVNDNDGDGRRYLEFASGIATTKTNSDFFTLLPVTDTTKLTSFIGVPGAIESDTEMEFSLYNVNYANTPVNASISVASEEKAVDITVPARSVHVYRFFKSFNRLGRTQMTAKVVESGIESNVAKEFSVVRSDSRIISDIAHIRNNILPEIKEMIDKCNEQGIVAAYENVNYANIKFFVDMAEQDFKNNVKFRAEYNLNYLFDLYKDTKDALNGYLSGEREERITYNYVSSQVDIDGQTIWANAVNTKTGEIERRPVYQTGFNAFMNGSLIDYIADMGFNSISVDLGIDNLIAPPGSTFGWIPLNSKDNTTVDIGYENEAKTNSVLRITSKSGEAPNKYLQVYQTYAVQPNTTYKFGLKIKAKNVNNVWFTLGGWATERVYVPNGSYDWQNIESEYTTSDNQYQMDFFIIVEGLCEEVVIDDVYVKEKGGSGNLLQNGNFEMGVGIEPYKGMLCTTESINQWKQILKKANEKNIAVSINVAIHYWPWFTIDGIESAKNPGNFTGDLNYSHERVREVVEYFLRCLLPEIKDEPALHSLILGNEPGYGTLNNTAFYQPRFQQYLRDLYDNDINKLNAAYDSEYQSFEEVTFEELKEGDTRNWLAFGLDLSKYEPKPMFYDWINFNNDTFYDWAAFMYNVVKKYAPDVKVSIKQLASTWRYDHDYFRQFIRNGVEPEHIAVVTDFNGCDAQGNINNEEQSLSTKMRWYDYLTSIDNAPVFNSEDHVFNDDSDNIHPNVALWCGATTWQSAIHGCPTKVTWNWYTTYPKGSGLYGSMMVRPDATVAQATANLDLNRLAYEVKAITDAKAEVAVMDVLASHALDRIFENVSYNAWQSSCYCGQRTDFVTEKQAAEGKLSQYKIVMLPKCDRIQKSTLDALNEYVKNGGRIIAFGEDNLKYNEYGKPHNESDYKAIIESAKIIPIEWEGLSMTSPSNREIRDMLYKEFELLGLNKVRLVDVRTNDTVYDVEWEHVYYNGNVIINVNNYDWNDQKEIAIEINGKRIEHFTELRSMTSVNNTYMLKPYQPVLIKVEMQEALY